MTINEAVALTLDEAKAQNSKTSQHTYRWLAGNLCQRWGDTSLTELQRKQVQLWCNQRRNEVAPATLRWEISFLKRVYRVAEDHGEDVMPPTMRLRLPRVNNQRYRVMSKAEELLIREAMGPRNFSFVEFAVHTGLRRLEQFSLRPEHVNLWVESTQGGTPIRKGMAKILTSKTGEGGMAALNPIAAAIAHRWMQEGGEWLFMSRWKGQDRLTVATSFSKYDWHRVLKALGIEDLHWHDLRHTCATRAIQGGARIQDIQQLLRHKSIQQTERYVAWTQEHMWPAAMALCQRNGNNLATPFRHR